MFNYKYTREYDLKTAELDIIYLDDVLSQIGCNLFNNTQFWLKDNRFIDMLLSNDYYWSKHLQPKYNFPGIPTAFVRNYFYFIYCKPPNKRYNWIDRVYDNKMKKIIGRRWHHSDTLVYMNAIWIEAVGFYLNRRLIDSDDIYHVIEKQSYNYQNSKSYILIQYSAFKWGIDYLKFRNPRFAIIIIWISKCITHLNRYNDLK